MPSLKQAFQRLQNERVKVNIARATMQEILSSIEGKLIGYRYDPSLRLGNLRGIYEITYVGFDEDLELRAFGRKVLKSGRLGRKTWDLGLIYPGNLKL